jgi:hypothetical protein
MHDWAALKFGWLRHPRSEGIKYHLGQGSGVHTTYYSNSPIAPTQNNVHAEYQKGPFCCQRLLGEIASLEEKEHTSGVKRFWAL